MRRTHLYVPSILLFTLYPTCSNTSSTRFFLTAYWWYSLLTLPFISSPPLLCPPPPLCISHTHCLSLLPLLPSHPAQPFIRGPPVDLTVNQSSPATFSCTAQGNPVPTISWTGPSDNFTTEDTPGANFTVLSVLTIDSAVRALHEGLYTCSASNGVGPSPNSSATLTVQGTGETPPPHNTRCTVDLPRLRS